MKINIILIFCFLLNVVFGYFTERQKLIKASQLYSPRFIEYRNSLKNGNNAGFTTNKAYNYKVVINVIKETDSVDDKPKDIKSVVNFTKDSINLLKKKEVVRTISYKE